MAKDISMGKYCRFRIVRHRKQREEYSKSFEQEEEGEISKSLEQEFRARERVGSMQGKEDEQWY